MENSITITFNANNLLVKDCWGFIATNLL